MNTYHLIGPTGLLEKEITAPDLIQAASQARARISEKHWAELLESGRIIWRNRKYPNMLWRLVKIDA